ncbi:hypothetical protein Fmac_004888 [Flemingia macrophylla]|uniref:Glycosyltransferase n=1 Tax=Flemingia macrophylla TaxID=520843 RepID=A0ABD1N664_9FABA
MASFLHQRNLRNPFSKFPSSPRSWSSSKKPLSLSLVGPTALLALLSVVVVVGVFCPWLGNGVFSFSSSSSSAPPASKWTGYTLQQALSFVAANSSVIVCIVSQPYLPFLNNWLISIAMHHRHHMVLVIAEDYASLHRVNQLWPGHAVLIPPVLDADAAHKFGSQGFFNFTARRPSHLLKILELGYSVMYNDVDMVWLADPFPYLEGNHDVYFTDDMTAIKPLNHSHDLPPPGKKGRPYICSCMIFLRPTDGAKLILKKWIEELQMQPWSKTMKSNDQPAFNWALMKNAKEADLYLLPQPAFPTGGLYFKNKTWVTETKGMHVIIHNNYIVGFEKKIKRFRDYGLWLVDDHAQESPLGRL